MLQLHLGQELVRWIAECGAAAVRLVLGAASEDGFELMWNVSGASSQYTSLNEMQQTFSRVIALGASCRLSGFHAIVGSLCWLFGADHASMPHVADGEDADPDSLAAYKTGSRQPLNAVQGPCQQRGIRCTDVNGDGELLLFERA